MAFTTIPYTTLEDVKLLLDLESTDDDAFLTEEIARAQSFLDRKIGYSFQTDGTVPSPATRTYNGNNNQTLMIDDLVTLVQVQEIQKNTFLGANGIWTSGTVATIDITADVYTGPLNMSPAFVLHRFSENPFYIGRQNYIVHGVFGQPAIPPEIAQACGRLVVHWYKMRDTNYTDTIAEQGFVRMRFTKKLPDDVVEVIDAYRKRMMLSDWG